MKVSLNTVKQFTKVDLPIDELVAKINGQLGGVEEITNLGERYEGAVIAKVLTCKKHPNADKLSVCEIDAGEAKPVQVVCGAPNVRVGMYVVWLRPGSTVPASFGDSEPFVLGSRELRGVMSNGMLASPKELGLGDSHEGILELDPDEQTQVSSVIKPGAQFATTYCLDDTIITIENKMFTHRPDCFGVLGVAREIAGIQHQAFRSPDWYRNLPSFESGDGLELTVKNEAPMVVPRFMAAVIKDVVVKPSPVWLQAELVRLGGKPINNVVDVTNYVMLLTGQPLHAYDYDQLRGKKLGARIAKEGETVDLLNGKSYTLTTDDIVIVDGDGPVGLGGVMGGAASEVSVLTKNVVLECANFDMYAIRKMSMRHGLFTDAVTRFNKGQSPLQNDYVLALAMQLIGDVAGGELASQVFDAHGAKSIQAPRSVTVNTSFINDRLGLGLSTKEVRTLLENVEFVVDVSKQTNLTVSAPFWRTDIELPEDVVEEIGRLYGYDRLPRELPKRTMSPMSRSARIRLKDKIRRSLSVSGANEVLTYSFVHERVLKGAGQNPADAFRIANALSPDLQYYRLSLLPSLLDKVHANVKNGFDEFALFEIGKGHHKQNMDKYNLPVETELVEMIYSAKRPQPGAAYYKAQRVLQKLLDDLSIDASLVPIEKRFDYAGITPFELSRSAFIKTTDGIVLGVVGELRTSVRKHFKLPDYSAAVTLDIEALETVSATTISSYQPLSRYPSVSQDLSLKVSAAVWFSDLRATLDKALQETSDIKVSYLPLSIYAGDDAHRTFTFRLSATSNTSTLTDAEMSGILESVTRAATKAHGAVKV